MVHVIPPNQIVEVTYNASFFATNVTGVGAEEFTYQWRHNDIVMTGEVSEMLFIPYVEESDGGYYECIVTNVFGDTGVSNAAELIATGKFNLNLLFALYLLRSCNLKHLQNLFGKYIQTTFLYNLKSVCYIFPADFIDPQMHNLGYVNYECFCKSDNICDLPSENQPSSHLVVFREIPI